MLNDRLHIDVGAYSTNLADFVSEEEEIKESFL
jgi:hypothetical protein